MDISEIKKLLRSNNTFAKKSLGQNFLIDDAILDQILNAGEIQQNDSILEIGPGLGVLTEKLYQKSQKVVAIELDRNLASMLNKKFAHIGNLTILNEDALKFSILNSQFLIANFKIIANIPYYITSPLINHFLKNEFIRAIQSNEKALVPEIIVLLIQKEVAEKICQKGEFKNKNSVLSSNIQAFGETEIVGYVSKESFYPVPQVESAILKINVFDKPKLQDNTIQNINKFFKFIETCFSNPRKQIHNNLKPLIKAENMETILKKSNIPTTARPENLSLQDFENIFTNLV